MPGYPLGAPLPRRAWGIDPDDVTRHSEATAAERVGLDALVRSFLHRMPSSFASRTRFGVRSGVGGDLTSARWVAPNK